MELYEARLIDPPTAEALARLIPQLSPSLPIPSAATLQRIADSPSAHLLLARSDRTIVGTLTLILFESPSGRHARIEDVVVDAPARRQGIGEALVREAIRIASAEQADEIRLSSNPSRQAAHRLYTRLGFSRYETGVFSIKPVRPDDAPTR